MSAFEEETPPNPSATAKATISSSDVPDHQKSVALAAILNAMNSKIVSSKRTVISSHVRDLFLDKVHSLSDGFAHLEEGDEMVQARTLLKKLCSKSIILPGKVEDETTVESESTEYELPEIQTFHYDCMAANSTYASPVSVANRHF